MVGYLLVRTLQAEGLDKLRYIVDGYETGMLVCVAKSLIWEISNKD